MNTTNPALSHTPRQAAGTQAMAARRGSAPLARPTWGDLFNERTAMLGVPAFFGPPIVVVLGPWLLLVFLLVGPLALLVVGLLAMAVAACLLAVLVAMIASPYLLIRHLHAHGGSRVKSRALLQLLRPYRISSRRPGSLQPKGTS